MHTVPRRKFIRCSALDMGFVQWFMFDMFSVPLYIHFSTLRVVTTVPLFFHFPRAWCVVIFTRRFYMPSRIVSAIVREVFCTI